MTTSATKLQRYTIGTSITISEFNYWYSIAVDLGVIDSAVYSSTGESSITCYTENELKIKEFEKYIKGDVI